MHPMTPGIYEVTHSLGPNNKTIGGLWHWVYQQNSQLDRHLLASCFAIAWLMAKLGVEMDAKWKKTIEKLEFGDSMNNQKGKREENMFSRVCVCVHLGIYDSPFKNSINLYFSIDLAMKLSWNMKNTFKKPATAPRPPGLDRPSKHGCNSLAEPMLWIAAGRVGRPWNIKSGWWYTYPSEKYESQLGLLFPIYGKNNPNVPNHQPEMIGFNHLEKI